MSEAGKSVRVTIAILFFVGAAQSAPANEENDPFAELLRGVELAKPGNQPNPFDKITPGKVIPEPRLTAASMEKTAADLRSCMQRAVVSLDDRTSDVRLIAHFLTGRCQREAFAFIEGRDDSKWQIMNNIGATVVLENRAPKWWQFWK